jgi:hypothetical protein
MIPNVSVFGFRLLQERGPRKLFPVLLYINLYIKYFKPNSLIIYGFTASLNIRRSQNSLSRAENLIQNRVGLQRLVREAKIYFGNLCIAFKTYHSD